MSEQLSLITYMMGDNQRSIRERDYSHLPPALRRYLEDRTAAKTEQKQTRHGSGGKDE